MILPAWVKLCAKPWRQKPGRSGIFESLKYCDIIKDTGTLQKVPVIFMENLFQFSEQKSNLHHTVKT